MNIPVVLAKLVNAGITMPSACGIVGNLLCEGAGRANNAQDGMTSLSDEEYTARVDDGRISRDQFARDSVGYGHAQWTYYTRKYNLYDYLKARGLSIADENGQIDFLIREMQTDNAALWAWMKTNMSVYDVASRVCTEYERPAVNNISARAQKGNEVYTQYGLMDVSSVDASTATDTDATIATTTASAESYWPPRVICEGMSGDDVAVAQALLKARGGDVVISGEFGTRFKSRVMQWQNFNGLAADGIIGAATWAALLSRR